MPSSPTPPVRDDRRRRLALSAIAVAILGAQLVAAATRSTRTWPVVTFSMYSRSFEAPVERSWVRVVYRRVGGESTVLHTRYGFSNYRFVTEIAEPLGRGDEGVARQVLDFLNAERPDDRVVVLRADVERYVLEPDGRFEHDTHRWRFRPLYGDTGRVARLRAERLEWPEGARRGEWMPAGLRSDAPSAGARP